MVVLDDVSMLSTGHNQYLQPDYLSPVPPTQLDAKKSPLALLAQTCSQIGADSPSKPLLSSLDKSSKGPSTTNNTRSPPAAKLDRTRCSPADGKTPTTNNNLVFKPYETNVVSIKRSSGDESSSRPGSKASSVHSASGHDSANNSVSDETNNNISHASSGKKSSASRSTPQGRKSASPNQTVTATSNRSSPASTTERKSPADSREKASASPRNNSGASPIIRSGMEILSGHANPKDTAASLYKSAFGTNTLCCPPGLDPAMFRPPFPSASAFSHHHATAALLGHYPGVSGASTPTSNPFLSYARVKTSTGAETLVPVCKDPYCAGCPYSMHSTQMMMAAAAGAPASACPSGCTQCDHQKYSSLMGLSGLGPMAPPPSLAGYPLPSAVAAAAAAASGGRPHVCSWMVGDSFCGKRFATGEELLQHLRTQHTTNGPADPATAAALLAGQHPHPLLTSTAALQRAAAAAAGASAGNYPSPSLSPLSARYHPYGKPPTGPPLPASLAASPYSAFNPLTPYYSPYALYGQRIGAAVHP